eukprot:jgi/Hompol1/1043/HPOL_004599-RA
MIGETENDPKDKAAENESRKVRLPPLEKAKMKNGKEKASGDTTPVVFTGISFTASELSGSGLPSKIPAGLSDEKSSIVCDWLCTYNVPRIIKYRFPSEKYTVPSTTAQDIGWPWERVQEKMKMPYAIQQPERFESFEDQEIARRKKKQSEEDKKALDALAKELEQEMKGGECRIEQKRDRVPAPYTLERFGKHARGRGDVLKWFGAREALP